MLEEINGFKILASYVLLNEMDERVILGFREAAIGERTEYVVAYCGLPPTTHWASGMYFTDVHKAFDAYKARIVAPNN